MLKSWIFVFALSFGLNSFVLAEDHSDNVKRGSETSNSRPETEEKKSSLYQKLSACLNERPSSSSKEDTEKPSWHPTATGGSAALDQSSAQSPVQDGQALFTKNCASCHSVGGSQGPISDWALAAERAGVDMPPLGRAKNIPSADLAKLKEFLIAKSK